MVLLKIRKQVQTNMTLSGEHDSDAYNFIEVAMKKVAGKSTLTVLGCYYFFKLCDAHPEVDIRYTVDMDAIIRGTTDNEPVVIEDSDDHIKKNMHTEKKRAYAAISDISNVAKNIATEMHETNRIAQDNTNALIEKIRVANVTANAMIEQNRLARQSQLIAVAQHLGKQDILETILQSFSSSDDSRPGVLNPVV